MDLVKQKLHRRLRGQKIYTALHGWESMYGRYEYRKDTETEEEEPESAPDGATSETRTAHQGQKCQECPRNTRR